MIHIILKLIATPKHFAVHSGPEPDRHTFNAIISNHDLYDTYLPAFEACIKEAGAYSIMCAYNSLYGKACCGSPPLLHKILRLDWGFKGYVVSDCGAVSNIYRTHKLVGTAPEAAALAVKSGTDLNCGQIYKTDLIKAVKEGLLSEKDINTAVKRLFTARFKLGMFDPPNKVPYSKFTIKENDTEEHRQLALKTARESIVLLKNTPGGETKNNILPLKKDLKQIAVIGPTADSYLMLLGNYNGFPSKYVTPLQGIKNKVSELNKNGSSIKLVYEPGCNLVREGNVIQYFNENMFSIDGKPGLKAEYFKNKNLNGKPFFSRVDHIIGSNWIYSTKRPSFKDYSDISSVIWIGSIKVNDTGDYNFIIKSDGIYKLFVDGKMILDDSTDQELVTKTNSIHLKGNKSYKFKLEYSINSGRPQLVMNWELLNINNYKNAMNIAKASDVIIYVGGITSQLEGEEMRVDYEGFKGGDRTNLKLPKVQEDLLKSLYATGKPVVLVITSGSAMAVYWEDKNLPAILQLWYPGEEGGTALADVLFGDCNPAGRLPVTFYKSVDQLPPFDDYNMKNRTYRYFTGEPLFPFGYGLSYTNFNYDKLNVSDNNKTNDTINIAVEVKNAGKEAGDEVVQLYLTKPKNDSTVVPIHSLEGFKRVHLNSGENKIVNFTLTSKQLAEIFSKKNNASENNEVNYFVMPGNYQISVGGIQPGYHASTTEYKIKEVMITGNPFLVE